MLEKQQGMDSPGCGRDVALRDGKLLGGSVFHSALFRHGDLGTTQNDPFLSEYQGRSQGQVFPLLSQPKFSPLHVQGI